MLDVNRCLYLTSPNTMKQLTDSDNYNVTLANKLELLTKIQPFSVQRSEDRREAESDIKEMLTKLSVNDVKPLVHTLMQQIFQIRGLLYQRLLKILVIVGHSDIECCYLMPSSV